MKIRIALVLLFALSGCAGVSITPISGERNAAAHTEKGGVSGYVVYAPMIVFQIGESELCVTRNQEGKCTSTKTACAIGSPTVLPDFSKPFAIEVRAGFGKAGVDLQISDGWRLSGVKDSSDNTALLTFLEKAAGIKAQTVEQGDGSPCGRTRSGLYKWTPENPKALTRLEF